MAYGTRRFNVAFTRALQLSLTWAQSSQFLLLIPISLRPILIFSSHLRLDHPKGLQQEYLLKYWKHSYLLPFWRVLTIVIKIYHKVYYVKNQVHTMKYFKLYYYQSLFPWIYIKILMNWFHLSFIVLIKFYQEVL